MIGLLLVLQLFSCSDALRWQQLCQHFYWKCAQDIATTPSIPQKALADEASASSTGFTDCLAVLHLRPSSGTSRRLYPVFCRSEERNNGVLLKVAVMELEECKSRALAAEARASELQQQLYASAVQSLSVSYAVSYFLMLSVGFLRNERR